MGRELELQQLRWRVAGSKLLRHLVSLKAVGKLSAQDLCIACHYCHEAGVLGGPVVFEQIPCTISEHSTRVTVDVPFAAAWENIWTDAQHNPNILSETQSMTHPKIYHDNPIVRDATAKRQARPIPLAIFMDGVRFTSQLAGRSDSVLGMWIIHLVSKMRYWVGCPRTNDVCRCVCRWWDSIFPAMSWFAWQLSQLACGRRFNLRQDQTPFDPEDPLVALRESRG
eukprot:1627332-Pyramimonas_sp.AAC.1